MTKTNRLLALLFLVVCSLGQTQAILNGSFEQTSTPIGSVIPPAEWDVQNNVGVYNNLSLENAPWSIGAPYAGEKFAILSTAGMNDIQDRYIKFSNMAQTCTFNEGETLTFAWFFGTTDYMPYDDYARALLTPTDSTLGLTEIYLLEVHTSDVDSFSSTDGWQSFEFTFNELNAGTYNLIFEVTDDRDALYPSYFAVDAIQIIPEPATLTLLALGTFIVRKRSRRK